MATYSPTLNTVTFNAIGSMIRGYVYNQLLGNHYAGATVCCYDEDTKELVATTTSDSEGLFVLYVPAGSTYFLIADAPNQRIGAIDSVTPIP